MAGWVRPLGSDAGLVSVLDLPHLSLRVLRLEQGARTTLRTGRTQETAAVFASGRAAATADGRFWGNCGSPLGAAPWAQFAPFGRGRFDAGSGSRPKRRISAEFRPLAHTMPWQLHQALWLPPDAVLEVQALEPAEIVLVATDLGDATGRAAGRPPALHGADPARAQEVGAGSWRRLVAPLLTAGAESVSLSLGETYAPPGGWSTYPPHRHDRRSRGQDLDDTEETQHEEIYICRFAPPGGFGLARVYEERPSPGAAAGQAGQAGQPAAGPPGSDMALTLRHGDVLAVLQGYHTVVAAPGYHMHYLWALAGPRPCKALHRKDPQHAWVEQEG
jgi:5-deoxy-D-glucuronate isomerase